MARNLIIFFLLIMAGCVTGPGRLKTLTKHGIPFQDHGITVDVPGSSVEMKVQYTGCGGLYILRGDQAIMLDPFFSNQKITRIGSSMLSGRKKIRSDQKMINAGLKSIEEATGKLNSNVTTTIFSAHSHYDHLMDVPAVVSKLNNLPVVYMNRSGFNTCRNVMDTTKIVILENHMTTQEVMRPPIVLQSSEHTIRIYPVLGDHNAHFNNIKFFSGSKTEPVPYFTNAYAKTSVNDWLEGNTFSFLIDYVGREGGIDFRIFIQSSSCQPPAGIPPAKLIDGKPVDIAFLGIASYHFSPDYPCTVLQSLQPKAVVWIHWEDFFRKYSKKPKILRGMDLVKFFNKPCVVPYKPNALLPWPGVSYNFK